MEVAGSAVGIASLGIQVCQGLLSYYDAWKSYDSDISSTYDAVTDVRDTLKILETILQQEQDTDRVEKVKTCVHNCKDALLGLEKKGKSLQKYSQPEGLRQRMRAGLQKSWYPFRKDTLDALKASVTDVQERLKLALQVLQLGIGTESQRLVLRLLSHSTTQSAATSQIAAQNQRILDAQQLDEFRRIVAWLTPPDPGTNHATARQRQEGQTGGWLLKSSQYQGWKTGATRHLWMYGKAGCGKTVLCSTAIEDIRHTCEQDPDASHAFFYFSFSDDRKQSDGDLLRSLVAQLGWREPGLSMLRQAYEDPKRSVPGPDELEAILLACVRSCSKVYLLVDALDECPEHDQTRQTVLARLKRLTQDAPNLRVFSTSRELDRIRKSMEALPAEPLRVTTCAVDADIQIYVAREVSRDPMLRELKPEMRTLIESSIASQADGMFRWAYCQLQEVRTLDSFRPKYIKEALKSLPPTLDDTYARMLTRIKTMYHPEALTLLCWLAYARSPPTLSELCDAAIIDHIHEGSIDIGERGDLCGVLNILSGLVTVEENERDTGGTSPHNRYSASTRVRLAHFSVKEYLESERILGTKAEKFHLKAAAGHHTLAQSCLTYLRYYSISDEKTSTKRDFDEFPLLEYAAESWFFHSALQHRIEDGSETSFLQDDVARMDWLVIHDPEGSRDTQFSRTLNSGSAIYYGSLLGLPLVVGNLLGCGGEINAQGGLYGNALQAASYKGHREVVQLLVDKGADVNAQGGEFGNALQAASFGGHRETVQVLVDEGADVNAQSEHYGNALYAASREGHREIVELLVDKDADINAQGGEYGNALRAASYGGHREIVQVLVDKGADVNAQGGYYDNALYDASLVGHREIVQVLVDKGADVNAQGGTYGNALRAASYKGHREIVQVLVNKGADVNAQGGCYSNALQAASYGGHREIVQVLVDKAADVNAQGGYYGNALQAASYGGHREIVQVLVDKGADVNAQGGYYGNALQAASYGGHREIVQVLVDKGADVNAQGGWYGNALCAASERGYRKIVQILKDADAT